MPVMVTVAERGRCFAFVTHPDGFVAKFDFWGKIQKWVSEIQ